MNLLGALNSAWSGSQRNLKLPVSNCAFPSSDLLISYNDLMRITENFDDRPVSEGGRRVGEGGFGAVYKGVLNLKHVAVKKLVPVSIAVSFPRPLSFSGLCV